MKRRIGEGSSCGVMITRGLMNSPIFGDDLLHFARVGDVDATAKALREAMGSQQIIAGVGYSMGAITLANYVANSGDNCYLDVAVSISGALDTREQPHFPHSRHVWQPMLAKEMRGTIMAKFYEKIKTRLNPKNIWDIMRADSMISLDEALFVKYHGFESLHHYYTEMGALADVTNLTTIKDDYVGKLENTSIPLLIVNALDDPIAYWKTLGKRDDDPSNIVKIGKSNIYMLLTQHGGHVGWPIGWIG
mmetsp:Transcript_14801/g.18646  ORF Transcript_14801/g.18646 Transcript_14801/m.18646 type:complete len:248 (-) Transcript_14801:156-899(-)